MPLDETHKVQCCSTKFWLHPLHPFNDETFNYGKYKPSPLSGIKKQPLEALKKVYEKINELIYIVVSASDGLYITLVKDEKYRRKVLCVLP